ncbi:MAG: glycerol-3-phosphate acyltransferase, partial [Eubacteriales bacterium]|nr:glycerol-3-phosphate acyltransferase [Eubacteriales bacterium]
IREYGSGNAGTTNISRTLGKKYGILTYFIDALKVVLSAAILHAVFYENDIPMMLIYLYSGLGVVIGHNFPFYLKFKGGKGIAASSGVVFSLLLFPQHCWILTVLGLLTFSLVTIITKYVSVGSLTFIGLFLIEFILWGSLGWLPLENTALYEAYAVVFAMTALAYFRHRGNILRLIHGNERKIGQKNKEACNG